MHKEFFSMPQARTVALFIVMLAISQFLIIGTYASSFEKALTGVADKAVDGDTFYATVANGTQYTVRLADLNAKELGQTGYQEAKNLLNSLIHGKTVYLDVDDIYVWDYHGTGDRLVCVVYAEYNVTHVLNVNKAPIESEKVEIRDYDNEFDPYTWNLYAPKEIVPEFPSCLSLIFLFAAIGIVIVVIFFICGGCE
jgi:hypothetical protein